VKRALLSWSGGKDSSLCLYETTKGGEFVVAALLTTLTRDFDRISMHGVRRELLEMQASALGLQLDEVWISKNAANAEYEDQMRKALERRKAEGIKHVIFGDLFLEDIRKYREDRLSQIGVQGVFPLWGRPTRDVANLFIEKGFRAILCCTDPKAIPKEFCGREFDRQLLSDLPSSVDPCGENGEFHTFVYDGPIFKKRIEVRVGEVVQRDGFYFADIIPTGAREGGGQRGALWPGRRENASNAIVDIGFSSDSSRTSRWKPNRPHRSEY
jgi:uncharacterized protein (TIGR00290 family)